MYDAIENQQFSKCPNFVFILADDLGYADLGCTGVRDAYNRPVDVSPNLDRLAAQGVRYLRGYANSAVCSPTRFALMSGRWQYRLRGAAEEPLGPPVQGDKVLGLPPEHPTLPSLLREVGYATALVGKWHLGYPPHFGPLQSGYDEFWGYRGGGVDYFAHTGPRGAPDLWHNNDRIERDGYLTDLLSDQAVSFVNRQSCDKPFLLSLHYSAPHWPWLTRDDREESKRTWNNGAHLDGGDIDTYHRMIHHMDEGIGQVMDALKNKGLDDNTLVVFTSDNGGERFSNNWPFVGQKMDLLEGGIRVPLIARWPSGIPAGQVNHVAANLTMDWIATMLAAGDATPHKDYPLDGVDLRPSFTDPTWQRPGDLFWRMKARGQRALVRGCWKYFRCDDVDFLFNIDTDARERANLAQRQPERLAELHAAWEAMDSTLPAIPEDARTFKLFTHQDMPVPTA